MGGDDIGRGFRGWPPRRGGSGSRKEILAGACPEQGRMGGDDISKAG